MCLLALLINENDSPPNAMYEFAHVKLLLILYRGMGVTYTLPELMRMSRVRNLGSVCD